VSPRLFIEQLNAVTCSAATGYGVFSWVVFDFQFDQRRGQIINQSRQVSPTVAITNPSSFPSQLFQNLSSLSVGLLAPAEFATANVTDEPGKPCYSHSGALIMSA